MKLGFWLVLYAFLRVVQFLTEWAIDRVEERIKGKPPKDDEDDDDCDEERGRRCAA
jgi:hypothetical protein